MGFILNLLALFISDDLNKSIIKLHKFNLLYLQIAHTYCRKKVYETDMI